MAISISESAARQIRSAIAKRGHGVALRLGLRKVGCNGLAYTFDIVDAVADQDQSFVENDAQVVVDRKHLPFIDGTVLDFVREGFKEAFKLDNPNAVSQCGCGESFSVGEELKQ
jgi:iron-sulfur cluster assembly protein